jgi:hypothetical protein
MAGKHEAQKRLETAILAWETVIKADTSEAEKEAALVEWEKALAEREKYDDRLQFQVG